MKRERLQELQIQQDQLNRQVNDLTENIASLSGERAEAKKKLTGVTNLIKQLTCDKEITISEHAVVRYLERRNNIDVEQVRSELLTPELKEQVKVLGGTGTFPLEVGKVRLENYTIVTYIP